MSTTIPTPKLVTAQSAADKEALIKHHTLRGYQYASIAAAPVYLIAALVRKKPVSVNSALAATWAGGAVGAVSGLGAGWVQYNDVDIIKLAEARKKNAYDVRQVRLNDYSTLGAILGAVLTPALFFSRARLVHSILGGASLGVAGGSLTHYWKSFQEGEDLKKKVYSTASVPPTVKPS